MAAVDLPGELPEWMESLGQASVRSLSVTMLIDLFTLEQDDARASDIATDIEALTDHLLMSGECDGALTATQALHTRTVSVNGIGRDGCRQALDRLGES